MTFQPESFLAVVYSIHFQPLVAQQLFVFNKLMLPLIELIGGRSYVLRPFLSRFVVFQKTAAEF